MLGTASCDRSDNAEHPFRLVSEPVISHRDTKDDLDRDIDALNVQIQGLSPMDWSEIVEGHETVTARLRAETGGHDQAAPSLRFYRGVVDAAVRLDRDTSLSCARVTTASFRRTLKAQRVDLRAKDIDHIVPRARGGVDHPLNYQILDASLNRSFGSAWNPSKCDLAGRGRCYEAVAISIKCGTYRGGFF